MSFNSTIRKKTCKCSDTCKMLPTTSFSGYYYLHAPQEIKDRQGLKARKGYQNKLQRAKSASLSRKLHEADRLAGQKDNGRKGQKNASGEIGKSELLGQADKVFGDWVKLRDTDKDGNGICPCCNKRFNLGDKTDDGATAVNVLHFVPRSVYSERFNPNNLFAGHGICNLNMHLKKTGREFQNYRKFLVKKVGEEEVVRMENSRRNINKLSEGDLREIINFYSSKLKK